MYCHADDYKDEFVFIGAEDFCPGVVVKTTHKQIQHLVEVIKKETRKEMAQMFSRIWVSIKHTDIEKAFKEQGEMWGNLMDDIVLIYAYRWMLFNKPISIIKLPQDAEKFYTK